MRTINAKEGMWLRNGDAFVKSVDIYGEGQEWEEVSNEVKEQYDKDHAEDEPTDR